MGCLGDKCETPPAQALAWQIAALGKVSFLDSFANDLRVARLWR